MDSADLDDLGRKRALRRHFRPSYQATSVRQSRQPSRLRSRHRAGFPFANWVARIPQVRDRVHLSPADLGLVLFAIAVVVLRCPVARLVLISSTLGARETARPTVEPDTSGRLAARDGLAASRVGLSWGAVSEGLAPARLPA